MTKFKYDFLGYQKCTHNDKVFPLPSLILIHHPHEKSKYIVVVDHERVLNSMVLILSVSQIQFVSVASHAIL